VRRSIIFFLITILYSLPSFSAFFNIRKAEKDELIQCGLYLYFTTNSITCPEIDENVTEETYQNFLNALRVSYDSEYKPGDVQEKTGVQDGSFPPISLSDQEWQKKLPEVYRTFEGFKKNIGSFCRNGKSICEKIQKDTENRPMIQRKKCNTFCSANTCKDAFTLSVCRGMNQSQALNTRPICSDDTVKRCLSKENNLNLVKTLAQRGWPAEWNNLEKYWGNVFLATATEPAKGKHIGLRAAQVGGVMAVVVSLPFIIHAAAPGAVLFGGWAAKYLTVHGVDYTRSKVSGFANAKLGKFIKKIGKDVVLVPKAINGCFCQCPS